MTTESDIQPYWFSKTPMEIRNAVDCRAERWAPVPGYSRYEWSDKGRVRALAHFDNRGRWLRERVLKASPGTSGYVNVNVVNDSGKQVTPDVAPMMLLAHHPAFRGLDRLPAGLETRHNPAMADKTFNAYPEGVWPGSKKENAGDKDPQAPQFPCRNFATCGNMVHNDGKRCVPCTEAVGREAATLLNAGANLMAVAERFGYTGPDWVFKLAVRHGGYEGTKAAALAQHPGITQRIRLAARSRRGDGL